MSHGNLRQEKNCLNCGHQVDERYCPHCGQENTETRQPFHYLFTHFFEDFTHYDSQFWRTFSNLMFSPGKLTKVYLIGKRQQFVPPVKLYIFVSFITFFLLAMMGGHINSPKKDDKTAAIQTMQAMLSSDATQSAASQEQKLSKEDSAVIEKTMRLIKPAAESIANDEAILSDGHLGINLKLAGSKNIQEYDQKAKESNSFLMKLLRPFAHKIFELKDEGATLQEIVSGFVTVFMHTLPKALFLYLPVFAFFLWMFHDKKKWWYFDHGVFTLHYFSYLLLIISVFILINFIDKWTGHLEWFSIFSSLLILVSILYSVIYFFIAHHRFYATRKRMSMLIGLVIFLLNIVAFSFLLVVLAGISFLFMH